MFAGNTGAYPSEAPFSCSTLSRLLASPANIRLDWRGLPEINILAFYENPYITAVKSFIVQAPEGQLVSKLDKKLQNFYDRSAARLTQLWQISENAQIIVSGITNGSFTS